MNSEVAWVLVSSETQFQLQIILDLDYLPDYLSVSYDYAFKELVAIVKVDKSTQKLLKLKKLIENGSIVKLMNLCMELNNYCKKLKLKLENISKYFFICFTVWISLR